MAGSQCISVLLIPYLHSWLILKGRQSRSLLFKKKKKKSYHHPIVA